MIEVQERTIIRSTIQLKFSLPNKNTASVTPYYIAIAMYLNHARIVFSTASNATGPQNKDATNLLMYVPFYMHTQSNEFHVTVTG